LLTLRALRLLRAAPVFAYSAPEQGDSFPCSIVVIWLEAGQREIATRIPVGPEPPPAAIYDAAAAVLANELDRGDDIALLCQGDALFYGSFCLSLCPTCPPIPDRDRAGNAFNHRVRRRRVNPVGDARRGSCSDPSYAWRSPDRAPPQRERRCGDSQAWAPFSNGAPGPLRVRPARQRALYRARDLTESARIAAWLRRCS
jgi:tetrapyrrole (corrin/porphyrin) methylase-like protein